VGTAGSPQLHPACCTGGDSLPASEVGPAQTASAITLFHLVARHPYLPLVVKLPTGCEPIPGVQYATLDPNGPATVQPAEQHPTSTWPCVATSSPAPTVV